MAQRRICVVTGSRAEYGLMKPLIKAMSGRRKLRLQLIVTGMHLSAAFGSTYREILRDGFKIDARVSSLVDDDSAKGIARSMGRGMIGMADAYARLKPDLVVCMGDRYEMFAAVAAALVHCIPVAHFSGGEITEGSYDDAIRHAITKMSHLHFTATEQYRRRVIQLGEEPRRVFNTGEIGLCDLSQIPFLSRSRLAKDLRIQFLKRNYLITFHPETLSPAKSVKDLRVLLDVLDKQEDSLLIFTKSNADTGGRRLNRMLEAFVARRPGKAVLFDSLGRLRYLSLLRQVDALVGNSSSALVEAPSFKIPAVNIGDRQKGRVRAKNVIDCPPQARAIQRALARACSPGFRQSLKGLRNPYGDGKAVGRIVQILRACDLTGMVKKKFHDVRGR